MDTVSILNGLITICKDGDQGFVKVAEEVIDQRLKDMFSKRAEGCKEAAEELQNHVKKMGEEPTDSGSFLGMLHRGWIDVKSAVTNRSTADILDECIKGETAAKEAYSKALEAELPEDERNLILKHYEGVKKNYDEVVRLRNELGTS